MKRNSPGFTPIIILLIVVALAGAGYYLMKQRNLSLPIPSAAPSSSPDITANWKTYTNTNFGFSLKYPPSWKVNENPTDGWSAVAFEGKNLIGGPESLNQNLGIRITAEKEFENSKQVVDNEIEKMRKTNPKFKLISRETLQVGGVEAEVTTGFPSRLGGLDVFMVHNEQLFLLDFSPYDPAIEVFKSNELKEIADQILSTFKFTSANNQSCLTEGSKGNSFNNEKCCSGLIEGPYIVNGLALKDGSFLCVKP